MMVVIVAMGAVVVIVAMGEWKEYWNIGILECR